MIQQSVRGIKHAITKRPDLKAQIDIIERDSEFRLIKTSGVPENSRLRHKAGTGHGTNVTNNIGKIEIMARLSIQPFESMAAVIIKTHDHAGMLDSTIGVEELSTNGAHFRPHG